MTAVRRLILLLLLAAAFLGGYYLGGRPGSPDIFRHAEDAYRQVAQAAEQLLPDDAARAAPAQPCQRRTPSECPARPEGGLAVQVGNRTYVINAPANR